ncbi:MAG TPA: hypothetical protein VKA17_01985 [Gammaproteobacteria bacterium]|nr:hypothetical protein [Gammaproteobacteria bacterium]
MLASFKEQVRRNMVAIISLTVALLSLSYNTWRNEVTEQNRNIRQAGFEMLVTLGEMHEVVFFAHYEQDPVRGNPRLGWAKILLVHDLSSIMPDRVSVAADALLVTWEKNWPGLGEDEEAAERISDALDDVRTNTLAALAVLR